MHSGNKIEDIQVSKEYGYWVVLDVQNSFTVPGFITGKVIKKGKKKAAVYIECWKKIKWKYPYELTLCE